VSPWIGAAFPALPAAAQAGAGSPTPEWLTWQVALVALVAAVGVGIGLDQLRLLSIRRQKRRLEQLVAEHTAELRSNQEMLEKQNKRLEVNNTILKFINARIGFSDLLQTILEGIIFAQGADRALALVREKDEAGREVFVFEAASGWRFGAPEELTLTRADLEEAYLADTPEIGDGIWVGPCTESKLKEEERRLGGASKAVLVMRIEVDREVAGYLVISDIRESDAFEAQDLAALEDLKEHMASAFIKGKMMEELRELNQAKNEFFGIAAHDLRSPLGGVIGYSELLLKFLREDRRDDKLWTRFLTNIRTIADDMRTLVNQLLDVTTIESGKVELHARARPLADLLRERLDLYTQTADEKGIELLVDLEASDVPAIYDRVRLGEVLDNLVSNAIKFTWPGGRIRVFCDVAEEDLIVHVEDNGQGLAEYELHDAFSGKRLSARPTAGESTTGLGLVIVKKLVELHRGRVWVVSRKGEGSTFSFSLPLAPAGDAGAESSGGAAG